MPLIKADAAQVSTPLVDRVDVLEHEVADLLTENAALERRAQAAAAALTDTQQ